MQLLKRIFIVLLVLAVLIFGVLFSIQNDAKASLDILVIQLPEQKVALWVLLAFALGGLIGMAVSAMTIIKLRGQLLLLRRKQQKSEKELDRLRPADMRSQTTEVQVTKNDNFSTAKS